MTTQTHNYPSLTGRVVNNLTVGRQVAAHPAIKYTTRCQTCGTSGQIETFASLDNGTAKCRSAGCDKGALRNYLEETPSKNRRRLESEEAARQRAKDDFDKTRLAELEAEATTAHRGIASQIRQIVTRGPDPEVFVDPVPPMSHEQAESFNGREAVKFLEANQNYWPCSENWTCIREYLDRNGVKLATAATLKAAYQRLAGAGMIQPRPAAPALGRPAPPAPEPMAAPAAVPPESVSVGWNADTGEYGQKYTPHQVDRMTAAEFKRAFRLVAEAPPPLTFRLV